MAPPALVPEEAPTASLAFNERTVSMSAKAGPCFELSLRELDRFLLELRPPFWPWDTQGAMERRLVKIDENKIFPHT